MTLAITFAHLSFRKKRDSFGLQFLFHGPPYLRRLFGLIVLIHAIKCQELGLVLLLLENNVYFHMYPQ